MEQNLKEVFGSYMSWKLDMNTWVIQFMGGSEYMYLLEGDEKALLIDTGYGAENLKEYVEKLTSKPILVVNTHYHPDHAAGNGEFEAVYMNRNYRVDAGSVEDVNAVPFDISKLPHPDYQHIEIGDGYEFDLGGRVVEVMEAKPAHCDSSLFFIDKGHRMLFVGDEFESAQVNIFDNSRNKELVFDGVQRLANFKDNADRLWALRDSYDYVLPNHNGTPIAKEYIKQYSELVDAAYDGTIKIEDKINHKYIEMDPRSDKLCRGRYKDSSIIIMKEDLLKACR